MYPSRRAKREERERKQEQNILPISTITGCHGISPVVLADQGSKQMKFTYIFWRERMRKLLEIESGTLACTPIFWRKPKSRFSSEGTSCYRCTHLPQPSCMIVSSFVYHWVAHVSSRSFCPFPWKLHAAGLTLCCPILHYCIPSNWTTSIDLNQVLVKIWCSCR